MNAIQLKPIPDDNKFVDCAICGQAEYLVSNDGSKLVYADEFGNIFVYDGKNTKEMNTENNKASELLAYDSVNKGVYYRSTNGTYLTYADEKEVTPFFNRGSAINMTCDDGYFYFKSSSTLYFTQKGSEPVELLHCSGTSKATNDDYCSYGIILYGHDKNYYLIKNGKAVQIKSEP